MRQRGNGGLSSAWPDSSLIAHQGKTDVEHGNSVSILEDSTAVSGGAGGYNRGGTVLPDDRMVASEPKAVRSLVTIVKWTFGTHRNWPRTDRFN